MSLLSETAARTAAERIQVTEIVDASLRRMDETVKASDDRARLAKQGALFFIQAQGKLTFRQAAEKAGMPRTPESMHAVRRMVSWCCVLQAAKTFQTSSFLCPSGSSRPGL